MVEKQLELETEDGVKWPYNYRSKWLVAYLIWAGPKCVGTLMPLPVNGSLSAKLSRIADVLGGSRGRNQQSPSIEPDIESDDSCSFSHTRNSFAISLLITLNHKD